MARDSAAPPPAGALQGKIALVTGAGRGIGRAIAQRFLREGARVAVTARTVSELDSLASEAAAAGGVLLTIPADLARREAAREVFDKTRAAHGPIDILVNNAGLGSSSNPRPLVDFDDDFWNRTLELNLTVPYRFCKLVLPDMLNRRYGRIINVASINGKIGSLHGAAYAASKHGLLGLTRTLAQEVAHEGITVNAICPGPVHTRMNDLRIQYDAHRRGVSFESQAASITPIGRRLEPEEIAPLAVYFASDEAACVTGQSYNIDGGALMAT